MRVKVAIPKRDDDNTLLPFGKPFENTTTISGDCTFMGFNEVVGKRQVTIERTPIFIERDWQIINLEHVKPPVIESFEHLVDIMPNEIKSLLEGLKMLQENPKYHPEPNTYEHVKIVCERLITTGDFNLILSGMFHDITKWVEFEKSGFKNYYNHDKSGAAMVLEHGDFIRVMGGDLYEVYYICSQHMRIKNFSQMKQSKKEPMRRHPLFEKLNMFALADSMYADFWNDRERFLEYRK